MVDYTKTATPTTATSGGCLGCAGKGCLGAFGLFLVLGIIGAFLPEGSSPKAGDDEGEGVVTETLKTASAAVVSNVVAALEKSDDKPPEVPPPTFEEAVAQLDELIGLKPVKEEVRKFASYVRVSRQRQEAGLKVAPVSYHMVFTGNPGTGKTTVARIMADIYRSLGVLKRGHLVETDRAGLVGQYMGETSVKANEKIDEALDGVLFIDEAYSLTQGNNKDYGNEAIAALLKRMEDDRDRLVVIVAGYSHEMKGFIEANSGLKSRFNRYIDFPDYSAGELAEMFRMRAKKCQYVLSADVEHWLNGAIGLWTKDRDRTFGNGRYIRNLFEKTVERQAMRVAEMANPTTNDLMLITMKDVGIRLKDPDASQED